MTNHGLPSLADRATVTPELAETYRRDGHVLIRGLADEAEITAYRPVIRDAAMRYNRENRPLEERDVYGRAFLQVMNLWTVDDGVRRFTLARRFARVAAELMGVKRVRLYHDQALFKEPGGGPTPFHQDQHYWPLDTDKTITMWMPLVPVTEAVGGMTFVSGSHRLGGLGDLPISDRSEAVFRAYIADKGLKMTTQGAMNPGDATFHSGWTIHGAPPNPTDRVREIMTVIYMDAEARVVPPDNPNRADDLATWLPGRRPGDLAASPLNPVVWPSDVG